MATDRNRSPRKARTLKQNVIRTTINALIWLGAVTLYYIVYSLFFDTPSEYELKHSTDRLRSEYELLESFRRWARRVSSRRSSSCRCSRGRARYRARRRTSSSGAGAAFR